MAVLLAAALPAVPGRAQVGPSPVDPIYRIVVSVRTTADAVRIAAIRPTVLIRAEARRSRGERVARLQGFGRGPLLVTRRAAAQRARVRFVVGVTPADADRVVLRVRAEGTGSTRVVVRAANVPPARRIGSTHLAHSGVRRVILPTAALAAGGPAPGTGPLPPTVLAFYYPWYRVGDWSGGMPIAPDNVNPEPYDSADPATIDRHLQQAIDAGIDGFIVSWWGTDTPWDANVAALEARIPPGFTFALYVEVFSPWFRSEGDLVRELDRALDTHGASDRYLRIDGRPVLYVFSSHNIFQELGTGRNPGYREVWSRVLDGLAAEGHDPVVIGEGRPFDVEDFGVFDGMHVYGTEDPALTPARNREMALTARAWAAVHGGERKIWGASIIPGYDDRHIPGRKPDHFPRDGGALYEAQWASATATHADQALIVSFNEWMETTNIEPNAAWGDQYLGLTSILAARYRGR
ncbi:MAG TPA: hypothetical protein VE962_02125 [Actinomycetota bacterium]|nr:hypothetical protein [Actinomycetota bacterium]